mmetsp:Transcript_14771/g.49545  ORF Transcript_14771/g.49545 Transcript_14771/m.49545 type:complete len:201 (-) Transcript_14771:1734-2336(-)
MSGGGPRPSYMGCCMPPPYICCWLPYMSGGGPPYIGGWLPYICALPYMSMGGCALPYMSGGPGMPLNMGGGALPYICGCALPYWSGDGPLGKLDGGCMLPLKSMAWLMSGGAAPNAGCCGGELLYDCGTPCRDDCAAPRCIGASSSSAAAVGSYSASPSSPLCWRATSARTFAAISASSTTWIWLASNCTVRRRCGSSTA